MEQCWDADPTKRPDVYSIRKKIREINKSYYENAPENFKKVNNLEILSCYYYASSKLSISKIYQFDNLPEPRNATEEGQEAFHSKPYSFNIPENSSNNDGIYNNPNLHPEEQNELEITDDGF
ncbi:kinase-like domain-containing protein [Rhizophagus irregularis DAOM 181602=DAOM 197198]|nr:kinase-like domain-containing protein [Rhizophagus irregularis DAOM 181602=DAOM 197198]